MAGGLGEAVSGVLAANKPAPVEFINGGDRFGQSGTPAELMKAYGLDAPFLTVAIDQERADAVRRNILIGGETDGGRFATVGSADAVFVLSWESVEALSAPLVSD